MDTASSTDADPVDAEGLFESVFEDYGDYDSSTGTITLNSLNKGTTKTIDGKGIVMQESYRSDSLIIIPGDNKGTYILKNMTIDTGTLPMVDVIRLGEDTYTGGKVTLENMTLLGYDSVMVESYVDELTVKNCTMEDMMGTGISLKQGAMTVTDSVFYSRVNVSIDSKEEVRIDNSYFETTSRSVEATGIVNVVIENSTFADSSDYHVYITASESEENRIEIVNCLFETSNWDTGGSVGGAISIVSDGGGKFTMDSCMVRGFDGLAPVISLTGDMEFEISNTTVCANYVDVAVLMIDGMKGKIINSTFYHNYTAASPSPAQGRVSISSEDVYLAHNTFFDNYSGSTPASLEIVYSIPNGIRSVNNLFACQFGMGGSTIIGYTSVFQDLGGTIDKAETGVLIRVLTDTWIVTDISIGCEISGVSDPAEMFALLILPQGEADGKGVECGITKDQMGETRVGKPDIGAITIRSVLLNANGGYWDDTISFDYYSMSYPYVFRDISGTYSEVGVVAIGGGSTVLPPVDLLNTDSSLIFLGWNTDMNATLPEPKFVGIYSEYDFEADETYYAVWGTTPVIVFEPGNGQDASVVAYDPNETIEAPTYGIINGMRLVKWTYDPEGENTWGPSNPIESSIVLYGQWENANVKVTFAPQNNEASWSVTTAYGDKITAPEDPTYEGYTFMGWYTQETGGTKWNFVAAVVKNMTLYAQWKENVAPIDPTDPTDPIDPDNPKDDGTASIDTVGVVAATVVGVLASVSIAGIATSPALAGGGIFMDGAVTDTDGQDKNRRTVLFFPRNGNSSWTSFVFAGRQVSVPSSPPIHPNGKPFLWWSLTPGGQPFDFMTSITSVTNLYAVYEGEVGVEGLDPEKSE